MNDANFTPFSLDKDSWRRDTHKTRTTSIAKVRKSNGVNTKKFHSSNKKTLKTNQKNVKRLLRQTKKLVFFSDLKEKFKKFEKDTVFNYWPIQEPALQDLDGLMKDFRLYQDKDEKNNSISAHNNQRRQQDMKQKLPEPNRSTISEYSTSPWRSSNLSLLWSIEPRIFAIETSSSGKRKYIVSHLGRFMHHYWRFCEPTSKHYYELIREGTPCRLYFDLEYSKEANPNIDEDTNEILMNELISELTTELQSLFNITINRKNIVDLDSSTDKKFSRHLIIHLPKGELFADTSSCGVFVKNLVGRLAEEVATGEMKKKHPVLAKYLFVKNASSISSNSYSSESASSPATMVHRNPDSSTGNFHKEKENIYTCNRPSNGMYTDTTCFIDTGVYTRNRLFRILGSTKYGKPSSAAIRIAQVNQFPFPEGFSNDDFFVPRVDHASSNKSSNRNNNIKDDDEDNDVEELVNWDKHAESLACTLVIPTRTQNKTDPQILPTLQSHQNYDQFRSKNNLLQLPKKKRTRKSLEIQTGPSPFPSIDTFVQGTLGQRHGISGSIRAWTIEPTQLNKQNVSTSFVVYHMKDNKWCENINRSHKSNNIMWNVSISDGTYWQTCHDPDCRMVSFRGSTNKLPVEICSGLNSIIQEYEANVDESNETAMSVSNNNDTLMNVVDVEVNNLKSQDNPHVQNDPFNDDDFESAVSFAVASNPNLFP